MHIKNSWKAYNKDHNRFELKIRIGILTIIDLYYDHSDRYWSVGVLNFYVVK